MRQSQGVTLEEKKALWLLCSPGCPEDEQYIGEFDNPNLVESIPYETWDMDGKVETFARCPSCGCLCTVISEL